MGINVLSLFDGMSCAQIALQRAGIEVDNYYASEIDKYAIQVTQKNYPDTIQLGDVTKVKAKDLPNIDLIVGGSPCQGFSFAGKQLNFADPRSRLFFEYVRILDEIKKTNPNVKFLLENVKMKKEYQDVISLYMGVQPVEINSALVSAQNRKRLYWTNIEGVGSLEDKGALLIDILEDEVDERFYMDFSFENKEPTLRSSLCKLAGYVDINGNESIKRVYSPEGKSPALTTMNGGHRQPKIVLHKLFNTNPSGNGMNGWVYGINGKCPTLSTNKGEGSKILVVREATKKGFVEINPNEGVDLTHLNSDTRRGRRMEDKSNCLTATKYDYFWWDGFVIRKLTPVECERLQTVPDNYTSIVSNSQRYKMLGNGWTVDVIVELLKPLANQLEVKKSA